MIAYICKYTPIEIIESFGEKAYRLEPSISTFDKADTLMHPNVCTYVKGVLEECIDKSIDKLVLVNCCDSVRRLYDVLKSKGNMKFLYLIDVPRKNGNLSIELLKNELDKFIKALESSLNKRFSPEKLKNIINKKAENVKNSCSNSPTIAIMGARCRTSVEDLIKNCCKGGIINFTCTGDVKSFSPVNTSSYHELLSAYSKNILSFFPCMRMMDIGERVNILTSCKVQGIIYHTVKFCDNYSFDYASLKSAINTPILKIETDYTKQCEEQIRTRVEAFTEALNIGKSEESEHTKEIASAVLTKNGTYVAGIDSGSTSTNVVILDENQKMLSSSIVSTGAKSIEGAYNALNTALEKANLSKEDISYIVSTGYGRVTIPFANEAVTEITCHAKAAYYNDNSVRTIIDIGGQDSKAIGLNDLGEVTDFAMNDKCAAGTGRFLDMMARTLEIPVEDMGNESLKSKEDLSISNMCTVFAESEVISLIAHNKEKCDIINGLNNSIAKKTLSLVDRIGRKGKYIMTGGVAKNIGVVKSIEKYLGENLIIPEEPQIMGALGAAIIAYEKYLK